MEIRQAKRMPQVGRKPKANPEAEEDM